LIRAVVFIHGLSGLVQQPMVDKRTHWDGSHQQRHTADVVVVIVDDQQEIEPLDPGELHSLGNALPVALHRLARINQQRLSGRGDEQRRLSALHVNEENLQRLEIFRSGKFHTCQHDSEGSK
jgi:hypothetical protein